MIINMNSIFVKLLLLILISSILTITGVSDSKASDKGERITEKAKDKAEDIGDKLKAIGSLNNNDNENTQNEFDDSESQGDNNDKPSIADELRELAQLKKEGIITEKEFIEMKEDLIE
jgi:hypothetical protein